MKRCARCWQTKPLEQFPKAPRMVDGKHSYCRCCMREYQREWFERHPEAKQRKVDRARERYREVNEDRVVDARFRARARSGAWKSHREAIGAYRPVSKRDSVPAAPFAAFIAHMFPDRSAIEIAAVLRIPDRRIREITVYGNDHCTLDLVDRALTKGLGRPDLLNVLYPYEEAS